MNICVIGGGEKGHFGNDFCVYARSQGHDVRILSHQDYHNSDPKHLFANFNDHVNLVCTFNKLVEDLEHIDIFLYNSTTVDTLGKGYYKSTSEINYAHAAHLKQLNVHVIVPHYLCVESLKKMDRTSKIIFMTSGMGNFDQYVRGAPEWTGIASYAGAKSFQNFLMASFATHNDKNAIVVSLSPHFDYYNSDNYTTNFNLCYKKIMNLTHNDNCKILTIEDMI